MRMRIFVYLFLFSFHLYGTVYVSTVSRSNLAHSLENRHGQSRPEMAMNFAAQPEILMLQQGIEDASTYRASGMSKMNEGHLEAAIADFSKAIELEPNNAPTVWARGVAWFYLSEHEKAIADFNKSNMLDIGFASSYWFRGLSMREMGLEGWEQEMEQGFELWPKDTAEDKAAALNMKKMFEKLKK